MIFRYKALLQIIHKISTVKIIACTDIFLAHKIVCLVIVTQGMQRRAHVYMPSVKHARFQVPTDLNSVENICSCQQTISGNGHVTILSYIYIIAL